jgi:hypothetical protein
MFADQRSPYLADLGQLREIGCFVGEVDPQLNQVFRLAARGLDQLQYVLQRLLELRHQPARDQLLLLVPTHLPGEHQPSALTRQDGVLVTLRPRPTGGENPLHVISAPVWPGFLP